MKNHRLIIFGLALLTLTDCSDSTKTFATYELNPTKEAFVRNNIQSYLKYTVERNKVEKGDSITLDFRGNIESRIYTGWWSSKTYFKYDSLFRVAETHHESCGGEIIRFTYEPIPEKRLLISNAWIEKEKKDNWVSFEKKILAFDKDLKRILRKTEVTYANDTTTTEYKYEYNGDRVLRETKNGNVNIEYVYQGDKLIEIKTLLRVMDKYGSFYVTDYISRQTGLMDSTVEKGLTTRTVTYYKYYPR